MQRMWLCDYPNGILVTVVEWDDSNYSAYLENEFFGGGSGHAPSLDEAMAAADDKAGQPSIPADWHPLRQIENGTALRPAPARPPSELHRRPCPKCPEYTDSLRLTATQRVPPDQPFPGWRYDGPQRVVDFYQCWWCGYSEAVVRPPE